MTIPPVSPGTAVAPEGFDNTTVPLSPHPGFTQELRVRRDEVCEWAVKFERVRQQVPIGWLSTVAWVLIGAGFGAWIQNGKWNTGAIVAAVAGVVLLFGATFSRDDRSENLHNLCDDFLRWVSKWEPMEGHHSNAAYVLSVVSSDKKVGLTRLAAKVRRIKNEEWE